MAKTKKHSPKKAICLIPGCDKPAVCRGQCRNHHEQCRQRVAKGESWEVYYERGWAVPPHSRSLLAQAESQYAEIAERKHRIDRAHKERTAR
jgi:hypothetical protein